MGDGLRPVPVGDLTRAKEKTSKKSGLHPLFFEAPTSRKVYAVNFPQEAEVIVLLPTKMYISPLFFSTKYAKINPI